MTAADEFRDAQAPPGHGTRPPAAWNSPAHLASLGRDLLAEGTPPGFLDEATLAGCLGTAPAEFRSAFPGGQEQYCRAVIRSAAAARQLAWRTRAPEDATDPRERIRRMAAAAADTAGETAAMRTWASQAASPVPPPGAQAAADSLGAHDEMIVRQAATALEDTGALTFPQAAAVTTLLTPRLGGPGPGPGEIGTLLADVILDIFPPPAAVGSPREITLPGGRSCIALGPPSTGEDEEADAGRLADILFRPDQQRPA